MNPLPIIRDYELFALQQQARRSEWKIFVATPFQRRSDRKKKLEKHPEFDHLEIAQQILRPAADALAANPPVASRKQTATLKYADEGPTGAVQITETIVRDILDADLVIADATGNNGGAILELGLALALKSLSTVLVITQDDYADIHFDLKVNHVVRYASNDIEGAQDRIGKALRWCAGRYFEEWGDRIGRISRSLTPEATRALNGYGIMITNWEKSGAHAGLPGMHFEPLAAWFHFDRVIYNQVLHELLASQLMWIDYSAGAQFDPPRPYDAYAAHATPLGKVFIETMWRRHIVVPDQVMALYDDRSALNRLLAQWMQI